MYIGKIQEWCPYCEEEVEIENVFKSQICPVCGNIILPCSICKKKDCKSCVLYSE